MGPTYVRRVNPRGLIFEIFPEGETKTRLVCQKKILILDMSIDDLLKCWWNWQMKGMSIQNAFGTIPPEQREFLLTAITPEEWKLLFHTKEKA